MPAPPDAPTQLTSLLNQWSTGDEAALNEIVPAVYDELHRVARSYMRDAPGHTLQATALINEAFLRFSSVKVELNSRGHFIGIVANIMRQILVDHARAKGAKKRGGDAVRVDVDVDDVATPAPSVDVLALESVLQALEDRDPRKVRIAELHYFCGANYQETATCLEISEATVYRELQLLRALLARTLAAPS
ncbi:MAG: ECF-type sigma factor [Pseudomonadota bacterium]